VRGVFFGLERLYWFQEEADDEVLAELKRCQDELRLLVQENERELRAMLALLNEEMVRQDIRRKLAAQDNEVSSRATKNPGLTEANNFHSHAI